MTGAPRECSGHVTSILLLERSFVSKNHVYVVVSAVTHSVKTALGCYAVTCSHFFLDLNPQSYMCLCVICVLWNGWLVNSDIYRMPSWMNLSYKSDTIWQWQYIIYFVQLVNAWTFSVGLLKTACVKCDRNTSLLQIEAHPDKNECFAVKKEDNISQTQTLSWPRKIMKMCSHLMQQQ